MAQAVAIVLADAQATPVDHTFVPVGPDRNSVWWFEDQSQPSPIGFWRISAQLVRTSPAGNGQSASSNRVNRIVLGLHEPVLETLGTNAAGITPPPTVSYVNRSNQEFILPERNTKAQRQDLRKMSMNLLAITQIVAMIEDLQGLY
jgi:hypothetical protein